VAAAMRPVAVSTAATGLIILTVRLVVTMSSAGLMPTEARGNYLPKPTYLRETKTYHSQPLESTRHAGNYLYPAINTAHFYFLLQKLRQIT